MSEYCHGAFGVLERTQDYVAPPGVGTIPVYIGRAPVHQLAEPGGTVGVPLLVHSYNQAASLLGYSDDWDNYELCAAVYAHFKNNVGSVGPIVCINALDPEAGKSAAQQEASVQFVRRRATLAAPGCILSTLALAGKTAGVDYTAAFSADGQTVQLTDLKGTLETVDATYYQVDPAEVTETEVIEALETGLPQVYYRLGEVPTLLCAPGWSAKKAVFQALAAAADKINGHWWAYVNADLDCTAAKTIDAAIAAKEAYEQTPGWASLLWPMGRLGTRKFWGSILNTVTMQRVDFENGNLPYETPSNKRVDIDGLCLADGTPINYDQTEANRLNAAGIGTMTFWEGTWRMWGPHTAAFTQDGGMDQRDIFDCNVRMVRQIANTFQRRYGDEVDKPMTRSRKDSILNSFQAWLDLLRQDGALLAGTVEFWEENNPQSDLVQGDFVFDAVVSNPVPGKSLTVKVRWTAEGLNTLYGGEEA